MDKPEDVIYLKQFVKQHPDNGMGWYLLGKHYLQAGKEGKANYCFIQAGDVYEAFEQESRPMAEEQLEELKQWDKRQQKKKLARKMVLAAVPLLLIALLLPLNGYIKQDSALPQSVVESKDPKLGVVMVPREEGKPAGYAMNVIVSEGGKAPDQTIVVRLEEKDGWRQWNGKSRLLMSVERERTGKNLSVNMLDQDTCVCEPGDISSMKQTFQNWRETQETHWTLASAIHHYKNLYGRWPQSLDELIRPYPNNVLSGEGKGMKDLFPFVLTKLKEMGNAKEGESGGGKSNESAKDDTQTAKNSSSAIGTNGLFQQQWNKPLEIVVDISNHRLAVVQNNLVVRSYEVGLGGDRTPQGSFYISEKVRDPNGTDDGIFGSRGMTLSNTLYAIHGTDDPDSIGKDESLGCIRMRKADVEELFDMVPLGTVVKIKNGTLPSDAKSPAERFQLEPRQNETNPVKVYKWLS